MRRIVTVIDKKYGDIYKKEIGWTPWSTGEKLKMVGLGAVAIIGFLSIHKHAAKRIAMDSAKQGFFHALSIINDADEKHGENNE